MNKVDAQTKKMIGRGILLAGATIFAQTALAQNAPTVRSLPQTPPPGGNTVDTGTDQSQDIVVTGSLLSRSGFDTPTPVMSINEEDLERIGAADIADVVSQIPAVRDTLNISSTSNTPEIAGGSHTDLRGLGYKRTLVLVDGRRYAPTTFGGAVSTSALPQVLIRGVDVVTGGASAAYGSDAVSGVVNYRMDDQFQGIRGKVQFGTSDYDDYQSYLASLAFGTKFFDGRVRLTIAGESAYNSGIQYIGDRPWANNVAQVANPAYTATNGEPRTVIIGGLTVANASYGGVINSPTVLRGIQFAPDGSPIPFTYGTILSTTAMIGGDGVQLNALNRGAVPLNRRSLFGRMTVDASDSLSFFAELNWSQSKTSFESITQNEQLTIRRDNAFLPQSIRNVMAANNIASFTLGRSINDNSRQFYRDVDVETFRVLAGAKGNIGPDWDWSIYYSGGWNDNYRLRDNVRNAARFALALDAVVNPATGAIVCRSTLTDPTNGCVPINLIGEGRASQASLDYVNQTSWQNFHIAQHVISGLVRGKPFSTWAGPVRVALGAESRWLNAAATSGSIWQGVSSATSLIYEAKVNVKEAFGEIEIPLALDASWAKNLSLNLAGRITDYSTSGTVNTWKAGINYAVNDSVRLRATRSRDIRAPGIDDLFLTGSTSFLTVFDPVLQTSYQVQSLNTGNPNLTPEKADTFTAGLVFTPSFIPRFRFSVDYHDINIHDAIIALTPAVIVAQCYGDSPSVCSAITRDSAPGGAIISVVNGPVNFQSLTERGIDVEAAYNFPFLGGKISLRALATYIAKLRIDDPVNGAFDLEDAVNQPTVAAVGGNPNWRFNSRVTYAYQGSSVSLAGRYVGGGRISPGAAANDVFPYRVNGRLYFDISAQYPLFRRRGDSIVLFGNIRNLLNATPPLTGVGGFGTTRGLYDVIGRTYNAGVRFRF